MAAGILDLPDIEQGADWFINLTYVDDATNTPIDLTGYSARMQVREDYSSPSALLSLDSGALGGITLGGVAGTIDIHVDSQTTAGLDFITAKYDIELVDNIGVVTRLLQGNVRLSPEVTK